MADIQLLSVMFESSKMETSQKVVAPVSPLKKQPWSSMFDGFFKRSHFHSMPDGCYENDTLPYLMSSSFGPYAKR